MDYLTFISNLVGSTAWPLSAFAAVFLFRSQITSMFAAVKKLKWKDAEVEFGTAIEHIREEVKTVEGDPDYEDRPVEEKLVKLVETHPHLAVLEGWKSLERAITELSTKKLDTDRSRPIQYHIEALAKSNLLPKAMINAISDIREVRNRAAHEIDASISKGTAYVLLDTIADVTAYLQKVSGKN